MPAATTSPASAPLSALSAFAPFGAFACKLTLLSAGLDTRARLVAYRLRGSARRRLRGMCVDIPLSLPPLVITVGLTPYPVTSIVAASLGASALAVTTALTAL